MLTKSLMLLIAGASLACAPSSSLQSNSGPRNANVITWEEIADARVSNAYDAVRMLRPAFLQSHGATSLSGADNGFPKVYLNHQLLGDLESLKSLDVGGIREIHYYNGTEAQSRFGLGNVSGAIEVITDAG
ncbi:MAG: hypothetical protein ACRENK_05190 [Gemmatimonadaceae bacterium]